LNASSARRYLEFAGLCLLAFAIIWWFGHQLNWNEVGTAVKLANWPLLGLAVIVISMVYLFRAFRWGAFLAPLVPAQLRHLFAATTVGFSAVFLIGRMGEIVRPVMLPMRDARIRLSASLVTVFVERIYDSIAVISLFAINLLWLRLPARYLEDITRIRSAGLILLGVAILAVIGLGLFKRSSRVAIAGWERLVGNRWFMPARLNQIVIRLMQQLAKALRVLVDVHELAVTVIWTALVWLGITLGNLLVLRAFGLPFGVRETVFVLGWSMVGSLVPTPGGAAGAFHAATAGALVVLGIERETAAAVSIVMHLVDFGPAMLFGIFYFVRGDVSLSRLRSLASPEVVERVSEDEEAAAVSGLN
jgi:uncharacterized protein (TIRG00374 family)